MSDTPDRSIKGLAPRATGPDLSRLQRRNRVAPVPPSPQPDADPPTPDTVVTRPAIPTPAEPGLVTVERERVTTYLNGQLRARAREAYRATSHLEGDKSWSDFVERAILTEVQRREAVHHDGQEYAGDASPLSPGRPLK